MHELAQGKIAIMGGYQKPDIAWVPDEKDLVKVSGRTYLRVGKSSRHLADMAGDSLTKCSWLDHLLEARDSACTKALVECVESAEPLQAPACTRM